MDINRVLMEMRALKTQMRPFTGSGSLAAQDVPDGPSSPLRTEGMGSENSKTTPGFGKLFERAVNSVNDTQQASAAMAKAYEQGQPGVDITDVMIASQKASVSFQAMVQVRNKLVEAYRDVMNMPI